MRCACSSGATSLTKSRLNRSATGQLKTYVAGHLTAQSSLPGPGAAHNVNALRLGQSTVSRCDGASDRRRVVPGSGSLALHGYLCGVVGRRPFPAGAR